LMGISGSNDIFFMESFVYIMCNLKLYFYLIKVN
jgi:hypothetical protein